MFTSTAGEVAGYGQEAKPELPNRHNSSTPPLNRVLSASIVSASRPLCYNHRPEALFGTRFHSLMRGPMALRSLLPFVSFLLLSFATTLTAAPKISVDAVDFDRTNAPMTAVIETPAFEPGDVELVADDGTIRIGQANLEEFPRTLVVRWIEPSLPAKQDRTYTLRQPRGRRSHFIFVTETDGEI